jgi:predicted transcriptional regulator
MEIQAASAAGRRGRRPGYGDGWLDAAVVVKLDATLFTTVDDAAWRERIPRGAFIRRAIVEGVEADDGLTIGQSDGPKHSRRQGAKGLRLERAITAQLERSVRDRLDAIAHRRGETRAAFVENALRRAVALLDNAYVAGDVTA